MPLSTLFSVARTYHRFLFTSTFASKGCADVERTADFLVDDYLSKTDLPKAHLVLLGRQKITYVSYVLWIVSVS